MALVRVVVLACLASYCLHQGQAQGVSGNVTVDNSIEVFCVDGVDLTSSLPNRDDWQKTDEVNLPAPTGPQVVGFKARDKGFIAGILASFDNGVITDTKWKCINSEPASNWCTRDFDDTHWPNAVNADPTSYIHGHIDGISPDAEWIWTSGYNPSFGDQYDPVVWCREVFPKDEDDECEVESIADFPFGD